MALILELGELAQENHEFEDILGYIGKQREGKGKEGQGRRKRKKGKRRGRR